MRVIDANHFGRRDREAPSSGSSLPRSRRSGMPGERIRQPVARRDLDGIARLRLSATSSDRVARRRHGGAKARVLAFDQCANSEHALARLFDEIDFSRRVPGLRPPRSGREPTSALGRSGLGTQRSRTRFDKSFAHPSVPPTVIASSRTVGIPTPTGTDCPSLPQVPTPRSSSRSLPIRVTRVRTSGPLPISVAPRTGASDAGRLRSCTPRSR